MIQSRAALSAGADNEFYLRLQKFAEGNYLQFWLGEGELEEDFLVIPDDDIELNDPDPVFLLTFSNCDGDEIYRASQLEAGYIADDNDIFLVDDNNHPFTDDQMIAVENQLSALDGGFRVFIPAIEQSIGGCKFGLNNTYTVRLITLSLNERRESQPFSIIVKR